MSKISLSEVHQADPTTSSAEPNSVDTEASSRTMAEDTTEKSAVEPELTYPEGGARGWAVAIGGATILFSTFGYANAYGVFQEYYQTHQLASSSPSQISWIGSIQIFFLFSAMLVGGPLFDQYGVTFLAPSAVIYILSVFLTSTCTRYWHFIITQGVVGGITMGLTMAPVMGAVGHYFNKKRGAAMGLAISGSSLGGITFPIMLGKMLYNPHLSFGWTIRICAFIMVALIAPATLAIKTRLPRRKGNFFLVDAWKNYSFLSIVGSAFLMMFGLFTPFFYLTSYAVDQGMSPVLASYLIAILNASSFFGRVIPGVLGDKWGRLNIFFAGGVSTAVLIFCFTHVHTNAQIIVFAALYGFCQGAIISGLAVTLSVVPKDQRDMGTYMGMGMAVMALATLIGPPINGVLLTRYHGFVEVSYMSGASTAVGALGILLAKHAAGKGMISIS